LHTVFFYYLDIELNVIAQNDGYKETLGNLKAHTREAFIVNVDCYLAYKSMENSFGRQFGTQGPVVQSLIVKASPGLLVVKILIVIYLPLKGNFLQA